MFLTDEQILSVTFGTVGYTRTASGFTFRKCTEKQIQAFYDNALFPSDPHDVKCFFRGNAEEEGGIMQDFITDAKFVTFHIPVYESTWMQAPMQIFVNGSETVIVDKPGKYTVELDGAANRVQLVYSFVGRSVLRSIEVSDGATVTPAVKEGLWLFIGDSITHGIQAMKPACSYPDRIALQHDWEVINQGNAGYFHDAAIVDDIGRTPDVITVAYGTNDLFRMPLDVNRAHMIDFYKALTKTFPNSKIFALSPIWRKESEDESYKPLFAAMYQMFDEVLADFPQVTLIDGRALVPHDASLFFDGLHPLDEGFVYYADNLYQAVTEKL